MRIELLEKVVFGFAVVAILLVGGLVVFFTILPKESGISREEIDADESVSRWYRDAVAIANGQRPPSENRMLLQAPPPSAVAVATPGTPGRPGTPQAGNNGQPPQVVVQQTGNDYIRTTGEVPMNERVDPNIPWLRKEANVSYMRPEPVSELLYQKYQSIDDVMEVAQQGGGEFVDGRYKINWIAENSDLSKKLGLQNGDEVISVNGHPVGNSFSAGRAMYDQLKNEKKFAVKVRRGGADIVLSYYVN